jgi:hypothetical protein
MFGHINTTVLVIALVVTFVLRAAVLLGLLLAMIKLQSFHFEWVPLIGATLLASALDMIPLVGHFIAVPALYMCIWKITRATLFPDSAFTAGVAYAVMRCLTLIALAYAPVSLPTHSLTKGSYADDTNYQALATAPAPAENSPVASNSAPASAPAPADKTPDNKNTADISIKGISRIGNSAMVTIQSGSRNYNLSLGEGVTVSTDDGPVAVDFLEASEDSVTLSVGGQPQTFAVK